MKKISVLFLIFATLVLQMMSSAYAEIQQKVIIVNPGESCIFTNLSQNEEKVIADKKINVDLVKYLYNGEYNGYHSMHFNVDMAIGNYGGYSTDCILSVGETMVITFVLKKMKSQPVYA